MTTPNVIMLILSNPATRLIILQQHKSSDTSGKRESDKAIHKKRAQRVAARKRRGGVRVPERLELYDNQSISAKKLKCILVRDLSDLCGGDLRRLMPSGYIPMGYRRPTHIDLNDIVLHDPEDWSLKFLESLKMAIDAAGRDKSKFLPAMRTAVICGACKRGGPRQLTSYDRKAIVRRCYSRV